jgi:hypothetical protein
MRSSNEGKPYQDQHALLLCRDCANGVLEKDNQWQVKS